MAIRTALSVKSAAAALAVLTLAGGLSMPSAEARYGRNGAAIAGIVGVLAAGALIAGAANAHAQPHPGYYAGYAPQPVYYPQYRAETPVYETIHPVNPGYHRPHHRRANMADVGFDNVRQTCETKKQMVWDGYTWVKHRYLACR